MTNSWKHWVVGVAAAASLMAAPMVVNAAGDGDVRPRLERACARVDQLTNRINHFVRLLEGGPDVEGSLAWLRTQIDRAKAAERPQLVEVLENRLRVRTAQLKVLKLRLERLAKINAFCDEQGL